MPVCTYMTPWEIEAIEDQMDPEIKELCDEIRELTGDRYFCRKTTMRGPERVCRWNPWSDEVEHEFYTLMIDIGRSEVQCLNLMTGLGGGYTREEAGAFLIGVRAQAWKQELEKRKAA